MTDDLATEIRRFYLFPQESYSLVELAAVWRVSPDDVRAIYFDRLRDIRSEADLRIEWADALGATTSFHIYRPVEIEEALDADFERVLGANWRTVPVVVQLPRCVLDGIRARPFVPVPRTIEARVERTLFEAIEIDEIVRHVSRPQDHPR